MTLSSLQPLSGFKVLITRPVDQSASLHQLIIEAGGDVVSAPLLAIEPLEDLRSATSLLNESPPWDGLIFVSANAVRVAFSMAEWHERDLSRTLIAAIGAATRAALEAQGVAVDVVPESQYNSEGLLSDPRLENVRGQRLLIVRGQGGRETLAEGLRHRGALVSYAEIYRRTRVPFDVLASALETGSLAPYDAVVITSGEALSHLTEWLESAALINDPRPLLVVPGPRLVALAHQLGWPLVMEADDALDESLARALRQVAHGQRTGVSPVALSRWDSAHLAATTLMDQPEGLMDRNDAIEPAGEMRVTETHQEQEEPMPIEPVPMEPIPAPLEATQEAQEKGGKPSKKAVKEPALKKPRSMAWVGYTILIGVLVLAGGGWFVLEELRSRQEGLGGLVSDKNQQVQEVTHQLSAAQSELASLHAQIASLQGQSTTDEARLERAIGDQRDQFDAKLDATRGELATAIQQIQRQLNKTRGDLMVTDAEYLLSVANQKLNLIGDVKSVLAAMEAADQRLHESGDPAVFKAREVLASEIASLKKVEGLDVVGLSSDLVALQKRVAGLPTALPHAGIVKQLEAQKNVEKDQDSKPDPEADAFDNALKGIKDLVVVRRTDRLIDAVLTPEQVETVRQLLLLKLETTRAALLRNDETLYRQSLNWTIEWVQQQFDTSANETKAMLDDLEKLSQQSLSITYPDISRSLTMLQNIERVRLEVEDTVMHGKPVAAPLPAPVLKSVEPPSSPSSESLEKTPPIGPPEAKSNKAEKKPAAEKTKAPIKEESSSGPPPATEAPSKDGGETSGGPSLDHQKPAAQSLDPTGERL